MRQRFFPTYHLLLTCLRARLTPSGFARFDCFQDSIQEELLRQRPFDIRTFVDDGLRMRFTPPAPMNGNRF